MVIATLGAALVLAIGLAMALSARVAAALAAAVALSPEAGPADTEGPPAPTTHSGQKWYAVAVRHRFRRRISTRPSPEGLRADPYAIHSLSWPRLRRGR